MRVQNLRCTSGAHRGELQQWRNQRGLGILSGILVCAPCSVVGRCQLTANVHQSLWMDPSPVQLRPLLPAPQLLCVQPHAAPEIPFGFSAAPNERNTLPAWRETTIKVINNGALLRHKEQSVFYFLTRGYVIPVVIFNCLLPGCSRGTGRAHLKLSGNWGSVQDAAQAAEEGAGMAAAAACSQPCFLPECFFHKLELYFDRQEPFLFTHFQCNVGISDL